MSDIKPDNNTGTTAERSLAAPGMVSQSIWLTAARGFSQAASLILLIIAARVLSAAELGAFALTSAVAFIFMQSAETGWQQHIAAWPRDRDLPPTTFWMSLAGGLFWLVLGLIAALIIDRQFHAPDYALVMAILSALAPLAAFSSMEFGVIMRRGDIQRISQVTLLGDVLGLVGGVAALMSGWGVFGLAVHKVISSFTTAIGAGLIGRWFAPLTVTFGEARKLFVFVMHLLSEKYVSFTSSYSVEFMIGAFLGAAEVGFYRAGVRIVGAINEMIAEPARVIAWSILPRETSGGDMRGLSTANLEDMVRVLFAITVPAFLGLALVSQELIGLLLGKGWELSAWVVVFMAFGRLAHGLVTLIGPVMTMGRGVRLFPFFSLALTASFVGFLAAFGRGGVIEAAASQFAATIATAPMILFVLKKYGGLAPMRALTCARPFAIAGAVMVTAILGAEAILPGGLPVAISLFAKVAVGAVAYLGVVRVLDPSAIQSILRRKPLAAS